MLYKSCDNTTEPNKRSCSVKMDHEIDAIWRQRLAAYLASGQSIKAWCKDHALTEGQYHYWRRKIGSQSEVVEQQVKWVTADMAVAVPAEKPADPIPVHVGRFTVEIKPGFDENHLRNIFRVLQSV